ncbi:putative disease resistance protein At4g27220 [Tasmannia lanceolata]|uniref:putative disease resistance protein At4g27220 n=1 Tax=Tasmannia lanceolata TaxID=3420 RepID=UPI004062A9B6
MRLEEPTEEVENWLASVAEIERDTSTIDDQMLQNQRCLKGYCPHWSSRYRLSKKAVKKANDVITHRGRNFSVVSIILPPPDVEPTTIPDFVEGLESFEIHMKEVMGALRKEDSRTIGLYGMGGVGKTTLMKIVNNKLKGSQLFRKVVMVTVSSTMDLRKIQDEIAERLGMKDKLGSIAQVRVNQLSKRLVAEEKVLIILDDVWKKFEVSDIGILSGNEHKGCKIVVTTRLEDVCREMGIQKIIKMEGLSQEDSFTLFKTTVGDVATLLPLRDYAEEIVGKCGGMPLALVTLGSSLKAMEDGFMWRDALRVLRSYEPIELENVIPEVISSLRFSYDHLNSAKMKLCFLFCCLFPEDHNIELSHLRMYGVGEGFLKVDGNLQDSSDKLLSYVKRLKASCLLLDGDRVGCVKMHDVVRGVAMWISSKPEHGFMAKSGLEFREWPTKDKIAEYKRISWIKHIGNNTLPDRQECPQLLSLLLQNNEHLRSIPNSFFQGMKMLAVLDLSKIQISSLPQSFQCLTNLRTLSLEGCHNLTSLSQLGGLEKLEALSLRYTGIQELPMEIGGLTSLKLLDLTRTASLRVVAPKIISRLSNLEELYMGHSFSDWEITDSSGDGSKASFDEVASLTRLTLLYMHVKDVRCLSLNVPSPWEKLKKFCIKVSDKSYEDSKRHRSMQLSNITSDHVSSVSNWVKSLLEKSEELELVHCDGVQSLSSLLSLEALNRLKVFRVWNCESSRCLFSSVLAKSLQQLEELCIRDCKNMEKIISDEVMVQEERRNYSNLLQTSTIFQNLRQLTIDHCHSLKNLLTWNLAQGLQHLEELNILHCEGIEEIISANVEELRVEINKWLFPRLRRIYLSSLPELTGFFYVYSRGRRHSHVRLNFPSLLYFDVNDCPKLKMLPLWSQSAPKLERIHGEIEWFQELEWEEEKIMLPRFQPLFIPYRNFQ